VLWPLAAPLVNPVLGLVLDIATATGNVILGVLSGGAVGSKGLPALFSDGYRYLTSGALFSSARTLGAIIFVLVAMAALAKFTLTRRPKDFTKWVSMRIVIFPKHALCSFVCSDLFHTLLMILCRLLFAASDICAWFEPQDLWQAIEFGQSKPQARVEVSMGLP
jgi:hypothetical protein